MPANDISSLLGDVFLRGLAGKSSTGRSGFLHLFLRPRALRITVDSLKKIMLDPNAQDRPLAGPGGPAPNGSGPGAADALATCVSRNGRAAPLRCQLLRVYRFGQPTNPGYCRGYRARAHTPPQARPDGPPTQGPR